MHCLEGKLRLMNERSILNEGIAFAKGTLHSVDEWNASSSCAWVLNGLHLQLSQNGLAY